MKQIVLMYHDVYCNDIKESGFQTLGAIPYKITKSEFSKQLMAIKAYCDEMSLAKESVQFTFDDGGESFFSVISQLLVENGFKGLFFLSTRYIGTEGFLNEEQIREIVANGHEIGAHSHTHPSYDEAAVMKDDELISEWRESINILNCILGQNIKCVSLPNGYSRISVLDFLETQGIKKIYTSNPTTRISHRNGVDIIGRYAIQNSTSLQQVMSIISSPITRMKYKLKNDILYVAKEILGNSYSTIKRNLLINKK